MAVPKHSGFLVPNAKSVSDPVMAEPDQIDFNTVANARWGVIEGCAITVSGSLATTTGGTAVVDGVLVTVKPGSVNLGIGGVQDRFDLVVTDNTGTLGVIHGLAAVDPVFPDLDRTQTLLASVYCPAGSGSFDTTTVDKRKMLGDSLLTKIPAKQPLVYNLNGTANSLFSISGDGGMQWDIDTLLYRSAAGVLRAEKSFDIQQNLTVGYGITAGRDITAGGFLAASNLLHGLAKPPADPVVNKPGAIFQQESDGRLFVWAKGTSGKFEWLELATVNGIVPPGTVIQSLETPDVMIPKGWIPLDGRLINENAYPNLFTVGMLKSKIVAGSPRTMRVPNMNRRVPLTQWFQPTGGLTVGQTGGPANSLIKILPANLPKHKHNVETKLEGELLAQVLSSTSHSGKHDHDMPLSGSGRHRHAVIDPGHVHPGLDEIGRNLPYILENDNAPNTLDALFNDSSHTYHIDRYPSTGRARTGIAIDDDNTSLHSHPMAQDGDHFHTYMPKPMPNHKHDVDEDYVGEGALLDVTPAHLLVYSYIRS